MKKTLLFISLFVIASLNSFGQKSYSDDFESYTAGDDLTALDVYSIVTSKTKSATVVDDPVNSGNNKCGMMEGVTDSTGLTFKIASGEAFSGFTNADNGDYVFSVKVMTELGGKTKVKIYGKTDIENVVEGETTDKTWKTVSCTFTVNTQGTINPVFVIYSWKNQKVYFDDIEIKKAGSTAIKPIKEDNSVKVYPNPANNVLYVSGSSEVRNVEVCDLAGRKAIGVNEMAGDKIDVSSLKKGVYLVKVTTDSGTKVMKVIKK